MSGQWATCVYTDLSSSCACVLWKAMGSLSISRVSVFMNWRQNDARMLFLEETSDLTVLAEKESEE